MALTNANYLIKGLDPKDFFISFAVLIPISSFFFYFFYYVLHPESV